jgi:hypothetical protein
VFGTYVHLQLEIRMIDRKEIPAVRIFVACTLAAYVAGEHLEFSKAPAKQMLVLSTTSSTSATSVATFNPTTFAHVDPPPPVVPPGDRQQQG